VTAIDSALETLRAAAAGGLTAMPVEHVGPPADRRRALAEALATELPRGTRTLDADTEDLALAGSGFDLVHTGALHRQLHPQAFLERLGALLAPSGALLVGSAQLPDVEHSELARFVPGPTTTWWVPGRLCLRWVVEAAGFAVVAESEAIEIDHGLAYRYLRAEQR
jgi:hypothetical protein